MPSKTLYKIYLANQWYNIIIAFGLLQVSKNTLMIIDIYHLNCLLVACAG